MGTLQTLMYPTAPQSHIFDYMRMISKTEDVALRSGRTDKEMRDFLGYKKYHMQLLRTRLGSANDNANVTRKIKYISMRKAFNAVLPH